MKQCTSIFLVGHRKEVYQAVPAAFELSCLQVLQSVPPTKALYQHDEKLRTLATRVLAVQPFAALSETDRLLFKQIPQDADHYVVVTAETIFYAQGGGQPSDTGIIRSGRQDFNGMSSFSVLAVRHASSGQILHLGRFEPSTTESFTAGTQVFQSIDGDKRHLNSRIHTAGHIVGLAVRHLSTANASGSGPLVADLGKITELKAQHYPEASFVDFRGLIDGKLKEAIQSQCDRFVEQALPIKVYWWNEAELRERCAIVPENMAMPVLSTMDGIESGPPLFRAVDIEGAGAYPCGGTHVTDTSVVGKIEIRKISRSKGMSKVSYSVK